MSWIEKNSYFSIIFSFLYKFSSCRIFIYYISSFLFPDSRNAEISKIILKSSYN